MQADPSQTDPDRYDVVIVGGAITGAACAILLKRWLPGTRVLIVERANAFSRKVGEATVEVSAYYLTKVLGLTEHLNRDHLPKQGLRFWFDDGTNRSLDRMSELGPNRLPSMASFHMDRAKLDEHTLRVAADAGAELMRPAQVRGLDLGWPQSTLTIKPADGGAERTVRARWVIDASGRQRFLGKRLGLIQEVRGHPTAAAWARWSGVKNLDGAEVLGPDPRSPRLPRLSPARSLSTNHFCGHGWWCWLIPLVGGQTSLGVVYDRTLFDFPRPPGGGGGLRDRFRHFLLTQPGLRELLTDATMDEDDFLAYKDLPYRSTEFADRGWALVGDAAAFLDPLYSPGLDFAAYSSYATCRMIEEDLKAVAMGSRDEAPGTDLDAALKLHNDRFSRSYDRWFESVYRDKYHLMGDPELVSASYFIDIGMYYLGVAGSVYRDVDHFRIPVLGDDDTRASVATWLMVSWKRRMVKLAKIRRRLGVPSRAAREAPWRQYPVGFELHGPACRLVWHGLNLWWSAELRTLWHQIGRIIVFGRKSVSPRVATPIPRAESVTEASS